MPHRVRPKTPPGRRRPPPLFAGLKGPLRLIQTCLRRNWKDRAILATSKLDKNNKKTTKRNFTGLAGISLITCCGIGLYFFRKLLSRPNCIISPPDLSGVNHMIQSHGYTLFPSGPSVDSPSALNFSRRRKKVAIPPVLCIFISP